MLKKFLAAVTAAVIAVSMSGCSKEYTMTAEDLELQKSLVGYWAADDSTGYNEYDEDGYLSMMVAVQFTDDFNYLLYNCDLVNRRVLTYSPVSYTIENGKFKSDINGVAAYAGISISDDGTTMSWITDKKTDRYVRFTDEKARELAIPEYSPSAWTEHVEGEDEDTGADDTEADTEDSGEADTDSSEE